MNAITLSGPVTNALGWTLVHAVWQGFALVLPVAVLLHVLRSQSSALRYRVSVAGLLAQVLASVATFGWLYKPVATVSAVMTTGAAMQTLPVGWHNLPQTLPWPVQVQQFLAAHLGEFVLLYLIGVAVFALRLAGGWLYLQRLSRTATVPASKQIVILTESLRGAMQLGPVVRVFESVWVAVPMVVGVLKPVLLLPMGLATNLSIREVEAVLAHELAHVKRHDYAVNLLQSVVEVLYFFHPALWWLSARVREEREHCCDDLSVQTIGGDGLTLAQALAHVEELRLTQLTSPALAMALGSKRQLLLHRVRRMLGVPTRPYISNGSLAGLTLATLVLLSVSVYAVQQQPQPKAKTAQTNRRPQIDTDGSSTVKIVGFISTDSDGNSSNKLTGSVSAYGEGANTSGEIRKTTTYRFTPPIVADSTYRQLKLYRYSMNDSLPALQATLTKLQRANTQMRMELRSMEHDWQMRVEKLRDPIGRKGQLYNERSDLQKQAFYLQELATRPSLAPVKPILTDELKEVSEQISNRSRLIDSIVTNEINPNIDNTHFKRLRRLMDSVRVKEGEIIEISRELNIEPIDTVPVPPVAPRPPKAIPRFGAAKPAAPVPPAPRPVPKP